MMPPLIAPGHGFRYVRRLNSLAFALTGEAASDGSLAFGVNLNFSLDPNPRFQALAPADRSGRRGPCARLPRSQRQWRARSR